MSRPSSEGPFGVIQAGSELQRMWLVLTARPWPSIAIVSTSSSPSAREVLKSLTSLSRFYDLGPVAFVDVTGAPPAEAARMAKEFASASAPRSRTVLALDSPLESPGVIPLALATDGVILVIQQGETDMAAARGIIDIVGRERVLGAITVRRGRTAPITAVPALDP
jgi:hypothetical protein